MKVGFIGYGNMTEALGSRWAGKHDLFVGGRFLISSQGMGTNFAIVNTPDAPTQTLGGRQSSALK